MKSPARWPALRGRALSIFAACFFLLSSAAKATDRVATQSEIKSALRELLSLLDNRQPGETIGEVYLITDDGDHKPKGSFRLARGTGERFRFEYEHDFSIAIVGQGLLCDFRSFRGNVERDLELDRTLSLVAGATMRTSTLLTRVFVPGAEQERIKKQLVPATFKQMIQIDGHFCAIFEIESRATPLGFAVDVDTGAFVAIRVESILPDRNGRNLYKLQNFYPKKIGDGEFELRES